MNNKCGLVNTNNPCRCPKKAKALRPMGGDESPIFKPYLSNYLLLLLLLLHIYEELT
jgi:hypothetical protein